MAFLRIDAGEARGLKFLRGGPEVRMAVQRVGADEYVRARRHRITAELVVLDRAAREQPSRRIEPQRFLHHLMSEGERLGRLEAEEPVGRAIRLGLELRRRPRDGA